MNIKQIFFLCGLLSIGACEKTDDTIYGSNPPVEIIDPNVDALLEVPVVSVAFGRHGGGYYLSWKECATADKYEVEEKSFFWGSRILYSGPYLSYAVGEVDPAYPLVFRIRAVYGLKISKWSDPIYLPL